jgi:antitoxin YefM
MMNIVSFSKARAELKRTMDDVCQNSAPTIITRQRGEPVVLISLKDYNALQEQLKAD